MDLFIDTSQEKFAAAIFNNNKIIKKNIVETKNKIEEIISFFDSIENIEKIKKIFINLGPGSFVGSRSSLIYIRTLSQINKNIEIFTTNTYEILKKQKLINFFTKKVFINATNQKSYYLSKNKIEFVKKSKKEKKINYEKLINNFEKYTYIFKKSDIEKLKPIYASNPQIGGVK